MPLPTVPGTALHVGMALANIELVAAVNELIAAFRAKGKEFADLTKRRASGCSLRA